MNYHFSCFTFFCLIIFSNTTFAMKTKKVSLCAGDAFKTLLGSSQRSKSELPPSSKLFFLENFQAEHFIHLNSIFFEGNENKKRIDLSLISKKILSACDKKNSKKKKLN